MTTHGILEAYVAMPNIGRTKDTATDKATGTLLRQVASACLIASEVLSNREIRSVLYYLATELRLGDDA